MSRRWWAAVRVPLAALCAALAAGGCARFDYELLGIVSGESAPGAGGNVGAAPDRDAGPLGGAGGVLEGSDASAGGTTLPSAACEVLGEFGPPELVTGLGAGPFFSPALFDRGLGLVFASAPPADLFSARRASRDVAAFGDVTPLSVNTGGAEVTPWLSDDGLTLLFASDRSGGASPRDLLLATRTTPDGAFGTPTFISEVNTFWTENLPSLHAGGTLLLFTSDRAGGAGMDIWQATRPASSGSFGSFAPVSELNSAYDDSGASMTLDSLQVYFTSERTGGARDLWRSERASASASFTAPRSLTEINTLGEDADAAISADGRELFFASDRSGSSQLWRSVRACLSP